eukprot:jgi/Ulvmu1/4127/UM019_0106.1
MDASPATLLVVATLINHDRSHQTPHCMLAARSRIKAQSCTMLPATETIDMLPWRCNAVRVCVLSLHAIARLCYESRAPCYTLDLVVCAARFSPTSSMKTSHDVSTISAIAVGACAAVTAAVYAVVKYRTSQHARSTTSSAGGGKQAYETSKAVDEYLQMHFATPDEIFPYTQAPRDAVNFPERCAVLVEKHCTALQDFTGEKHSPIALDVGCAVGGSSFHLTKAGFGNVLGLDFSTAFINAANKMKADGYLSYRTVIEGDITEMRRAVVPDETDTDKVSFQVGDACNLPKNLAPVDAVLAANLICRLPEPRSFLDRLPTLIKPGGVVVLTTPFSWLEAWTRKNRWLGGYMEEGRPVSSFSELKKVMEGNGFQLKAQEEMPFVIREHARKFQWGCALGSAWVKA